MENIHQNTCDGSNNSSGGTEASDNFFGLEIQGRALSLSDEKELKAKRGFNADTLAALRFFSVNEADLSAIGVTRPHTDLPSTIVVPYLTETKGGRTLSRLHKTSAENFEYPPYLTPARAGSNDIVITESEMKAAMVYQLGDQGIGLQGAASFIRRIPILANAIRSRGGLATVYVLPDHERLLVGGKKVVYEPTIQMLRLAYALSLDLGIPVKIITLPDKYLEPSQTKKGEPKVKADLDGCVAKGMTEEDWHRLKDAAKVPWELEIPVQYIVAGMAVADPEEFLKATLLKGRLEKLSVDETVAACSALADALTSRSYDPATKSCDENKVDAYFKRAVVWAKENGIAGVTQRTFKRARGVSFDEDDGIKTIAHCLAEVSNAVVLVKNGNPIEMVSSFILLSCAYGEVRYPGSQSRRRYRVKIQTSLAGKTHIREILVDGDLFCAENYTKACADLTVVDSKRFRSYVAEKLGMLGFQKHDPELDQLLFTGLVQEEGHYIASARVSYPRGEEDCWYHEKTFPDMGDADKSFQQVAGISRNSDVLFVSALGAPLKAILKFYPHALVVGRRYTGKTTTAKAIKARTGLDCVSAKRQLGSNYRQLRAMGNHNLPIFLDECHRVDKYAIAGMLETLNTSYNGATTTHGTDGRYYVAGCAIVLGQDKPEIDEALDSKQVILHFALKDLNKAGVKYALNTVESFPFVKWLEFLAANATEAQTELGLKEQWLLTRLNQHGIAREEGDRTILNYAAVLVSAEYLQRFGVKAQIDDKIVELCALHITGKLHATDVGQARSSAEKFVRDILNALALIQTRQHRAGTFDITIDGVYFQLTPWFEYLKHQKPDAYDERFAARMGESLSEDMRPKGMIQRKHKFGTHRGDAWLIPKSLCIELGYEFDENDAATGGDQIA